MFIGASDGQGWRYEVLDESDGFFVRMRDLDTGAIEDEETRVFRTAAVAFAYAGLSAAFERYAAARIAGDEAEEPLLAERLAQQALYEDLSRRLGDEGLAAHLLLERAVEEEARRRRRLH